MGSWVRRAMAAIHPEGIPWPGSVAYDALTRSSIFQRHYDLVADDILRHGREGRLLDIGTGSARLLLALHRKAPALRLTGIDISPAMVERARRNVARAGLRGAIAVRQGDAGRLSFPDGSFDFVVSTGSLHHWRRPVEGLNEVHRVLRPGGWALVYDLPRHLPHALRATAAREFGRLRLWLCRLHSFEEPFRSPGEMEGLARQTRFGGGETHFVGLLCCLTLRALGKAGAPDRGP